MSYCRIGDDSDVYVFCAGDSFEIISRGGACERRADAAHTLAYLLQLRENGIVVPQRAIDRLRKEKSAIDNRDRSCNE